MPPKPTNEFDSPWKDAIGRHFADFLAFFFPNIYRNVDWSQGYTLLDKELHKIVPDSAQGRRDADVLIRISRRSGQEQWVLIHVEVQSQHDSGFPKRMDVYHHRIRDCYDKDVVSLAILGDEHPNWRPDHYRYALWGCRKNFKFLMRKLLDFPLEAAEPKNPFSWLVAAHRQAQQTSHEPAVRLVAKRRMLRGLYQNGLTREQILEFFRFIDWVLALPQPMEYALQDEIASYEEELKMPYITSAERIGIAKGEADGIVKGQNKGLREAILRVARVRWGGEAVGWAEKLAMISDYDRLNAILDEVVVAESAGQVTF